MRKNPVNFSDLSWFFNQSQSYLIYDCNKVETEGKNLQIVKKIRFVKPTKESIALITWKSTDKREEHLERDNDWEADLSFSFNSGT